MKNTLNNKNYINIYQYFCQKVRQAERPPKIFEIIILYVYTKCLLEIIPSLIHKIVPLFKTLQCNEGEKYTLRICRPRIESNEGMAPCSGCQLPEKRKNKFQ
jgi:hypothetical protein